MKKIVLFLAFIVCTWPSYAKDSSAVESSLAWLKVVDAGRYGESWDQAAPFFKKSVSRRNWEQALNQVRTPLGGLVSRNVKDAKEYLSLPGVPDGEYVVITLNSSFDKKKSAIETITLSNVEDTWRVIGYFIN
tara:strand:+ start:839 stop:1237 length:399 start_codon:yes stop_codon:yes gene_type:complete